MARHVLEGELPTFFWAQSHGGTLEAFLTAGVFAVFGSSVLALKLVAIALFAVGAVLVWRIGRRTVGNDAAVVAAAAFWVWPGYIVWKSTRALSFYASGLVLALVVVLFALRLRERVSRVDAALLGLATGAAWWVTPQVAFLVAPAIGWLVWRQPAVLRVAPIGVATAVVGALPWIVWNVRHDWHSLDTGPESGDDTYFDHLIGFAASTFPSFLGVRVPFSLDWLAGELLGRAVTAAAVAGFLYLVVRAVRRQRDHRHTPGSATATASPLECVLVIGALYPLVYALSPYSWFIDEPRYLFLLAPVAALLVGYALDARWWAPPAGIAVAIAASAVVLLAMERDGAWAREAGGARVPADLGPALAALRDHGVTRVLADYWIAYRVSFESEERIIATSTGVVRYAPHDRLVRGAADRARLVVAGSAEDAALRRRGVMRVEAGDWVVYLRERR